MTDSVFSDHNYIEYQRGTSNIILTVPHGGSLRPSHIPDRDAGASVNGQIVYTHCSTVIKDHRKYSVRYKKDTFTQELGLMLADKLEQIMGHRPHVVLCHLYRGKLDANCDFEKAAFGVPEAEDAWYAWHDFISQAKNQIEEGGQRGLLMDIHGHRHQEDWIELGYTLSATQLNEQSFSAEQTSIRGLLEKNKLSASKYITSMIQGENSFGGILARYNYRVVPSPQHPGPKSGNYYTGGYNTLCHGSQEGGAIDSLQLENPKSLRNAKAAPAYTQNLASAIAEFVNLYYLSR